jgi:hypothetical protein
MTQPVAGARAVVARVRRDYLRPPRLGELDRFVCHALARGYRTMTLSEFAADAPATGRILLLRHDVDSDVTRARRMFALEQRLGVTGSWFFRRRTWDVALMRELASAGAEVGYHYEELADLIKQRGAATAEAARALIGPARERLRAALPALRASSGLPLDVLASHGDFANAAVGVTNVELLEDRAFRAAIGVRLEAYDVEHRVDARFTDAARVARWWPGDPAEALERGEQVVEVLVHPRAWGAAPVANAREDLHRLGAGVGYGLRRALGARSRAGSGG